MKKNDIALIILIAASSAIITYIAASTVLKNYTQQTTKVPVVEKITSDIVKPDPNIFNEDAINPSVPVNIENNGSQGSSTD